MKYDRQVPNSESKLRAALDDMHAELDRERALSSDLRAALATSQAEVERVKGERALFIADRAEYETKWLDELAKREAVQRELTFEKYEATKQLAAVTRERDEARNTLGICEKPGACNCLPCIYGRYSEERAAYREEARNLRTERDDTAAKLAEVRKFIANAFEICNGAEMLDRDIGNAVDAPPYVIERRAYRAVLAILTAPTKGGG